RGLLHHDRIRWDTPRQLTALAKRALGEGGDAQTSRARILCLLAADLWPSGSATTLRHLRAALEAGERAADEEGTIVALVNLLQDEGIAGEGTPGLLERALAVAEATEGRMLPRGPHFEPPGSTLGAVLMRLARFDEARALLERAREDGLAQGAYPAVGFTCYWLTELLCRLGEFSSAATYAAECAELWDQLGFDDESP